MTRLYRRKLEAQLYPSDDWQAACIPAQRALQEKWTTQHHISHTSLAFGAFRAWHCYT